MFEFILHNQLYQVHYQVLLFYERLSLTKVTFIGYPAAICDFWAFCIDGFQHRLTLQ